MKAVKCIKKIFAAGAIFALAGATLLAAGCTSQADIDLAVQSALKEQGKINQDSIDKILDAQNKAIAEAVAAVDVTADNQAAVDEATKLKEDEIARLNQVIADYAEVEKEVAKEDAGYIIDEIGIGDNFAETLSDREVSKLFDSKIKFDGDSYDAEETVSLTGDVLANEEDYKGEVYLNLEEGAVEYSYEVSNQLDTSDITEDETLVFNFLGQEVEVSEWDVDKITFTKGNELFLKEGESTMVGDKPVIVKIVNDNYAYVQVGVDSRKVEEGDVEEIGGLEVEAKEVLDDEEGDDYVVMKFAEEVLVEVEDGDEYDLDDKWTWVVEPNKLGLVLDAEYNDLDDDNKPLKAGDKVCLPNNYVCFKYNGLLNNEFTQITIDDDNDYDAELRGDFIKGTDDYSRVYVNASGFYDEDDKLIHVSELLIDNTEDDIKVKIVGTKLEIGDVEIPLALDGIKVGGDDISSFDETYVTDYGFYIKDHENSVDDNKFSIDVPKDEAENTILVY